MRFILLSYILLISSFVSAQNHIAGNWWGTLRTPSQNLRLAFRIVCSSGEIKTTMDSPDQGAMGLLVNHTVFHADTIKMSLTELRASYVGVLKGDGSIEGTFKQSGMSFPLNLHCGEVELNRPQTPKAPFDYQVEEVRFINKHAGNIQLAGTLTLPKNVAKAPVAVLISGSGLQDRNESIYGHKPFAVMADYLTNRGIAVLRFDDRSFGESEGDATHATTADFATDVEAAIDFLRKRKDIDKKRIGLIGHSEGGLIAPMVAAQRKDVAWVVLLASPGVSGNELLLEQQQLMGKAGGMNDKQLEALQYNNAKMFDIVKSSATKEQASDSIWNYMEASGLMQEFTFNRAAFAKQVEQLTTDWMLYFLKYDPTEVLPQVKCPVLISNGKKDLQVSVKQNVPPLRLALKLSGNKQVTVKEYEDLNHLFQECRTGSIGEYSLLEQTISPQVLQDICAWVSKECE
ncbi:MAG: alpha/beta hydrolase family protein [Mangrovibacterium sp.]